MDKEKIKGVIEAILFSTGRVVKIKDKKLKYTKLADKSLKDLEDILKCNKIVCV